MSSFLQSTAGSIFKLIVSVLSLKSTAGSHSRDVDSLTLTAGSIFKLIVVPFRYWYLVVKFLSVAASELAVDRSCFALVLPATLLIVVPQFEGSISGVLVVSYFKSIILSLQFRTLLIVVCCFDYQCLYIGFICI